MAKKLVAVTNIKHNGELTPAGETLDASKFDKKVLEELYDAGAVRVEETEDKPESVKTPEAKPEVKPEAKAEVKEDEKPKQTAAAQPATSPVTSPAKTVAAPKGTTVAKNSAK